jgi:hypothetical protein
MNCVVPYPDCDDSYLANVRHRYAVSKHNASNVSQVYIGASVKRYKYKEASDLILARALKESAPPILKIEVSLKRNTRLLI